MTDSGVGLSVERGAAVPAPSPHAHPKDVTPMPDIDQMKDQTQNAEETAKDKAGGGMDGLKSKLDANGDGKTDAEDLKTMAKGATDKVKGLFNKS